MGAQVIVNGREVSDRIAGYSVNEEATPIEVSNMAGGVSQLTIETEDSDLTVFARRKPIQVIDQSLGTTIGKVSSSSGNGLTRSLTADSRLVALVVKRRILPYSGTLHGYLSVLFQQCGLKVTEYMIDYTLTSIPLVARGTEGLVWDRVKQVCSAHQIEVSLVSNLIVVRKIRQTTAVRHRDSSVALAIDDTGLAQKIIVNYLHEAVQRTSLCYPLGGWTMDEQVLTVEANETIEYTFDLQPDGEEGGLGASLSSVSQPVCVDYVDRNHTSSSVYCVSGSDKLPVVAAEWKAKGGDIKVSIDPDTQTLRVKVTGPTDPNNSPYSIATTTREGGLYSSLRLVGTGVFYDKRRFEWLTGNNPDDAEVEVGVEVDNPMLVGREAAQRAAIATLAAFGAPKVSIAVTTRGINRRSDNGSMAVFTVADWNTAFATYNTVELFNSLYVNITVGWFSEVMLSNKQSEFENQAFGNITGSRVLEDGHYYRITSSTVGPATISYTAESDTTIADWNANYSGMTVADFNALVAGKDFGDLAVRPLL